MVHTYDTHDKHPPPFLLHLVEVVGASVVNIMAEAGGYHGHALQVCVVTLQITCLSER